MVRALLDMPRDGRGSLDLGNHGRRDWAMARLVFVLALVVISGCAIVPRSRMDECQKLTQALRADNTRLKDRVLAVQSQNRDYAERAVDDGRRLAIQDEAIERLEHSVQAYQDERARLEAAYNQLASNLGVTKRDVDGGRPASGSQPTRAGESGPPASARNTSSSSGVDEGTPR
jgi:hypothetical protein